MIAASDVASIAGPALLASPLVGIAVTWTLLGKLQAWTISSSSIGGGKGNGDDDKCPADAPTGVDAVSARSQSNEKVQLLTRLSHFVETVNAKETVLHQIRSAKRYRCSSYIRFVDVLTQCRGNIGAVIAC